MFDGKIQVIILSSNIHLSPFSKEEQRGFILKTKPMGIKFC